MSDNERERIEHLLIQEFPAVKALEPGDFPLVEPFKGGAFMPSMLGLMLYSNGYNLRGASRCCRNGLLYADGETLFGIGIFRKTLESKLWHIMISGPWGLNGFDKVDRFIGKVRMLVDCGEIYIRHLAEPDFAIFLSKGYLSIDANPWCAAAPSEDETLNHKKIRLDEIVGYDDQGRFTIKTLKGEERRGFRVKARLAFNRFSNFLKRNRLRLTIQDYRAEHRTIAENLVRDHFAMMKNPVGSTPEDYLGLIHFDAPAGEDQFFGKIGFIEHPERRIPALLFLGEKTAEDTVALYATFAARDPLLLGSSIDTTGFSAISQYAYLAIFQILFDAGIHWVDLGGSETEELNNFKRQLGALPGPSHWVVAPPWLHAPGNQNPAVPRLPGGGVV